MNRSFIALRTECEVLEVEACLKFKHTTRQAVGGRAEQRIGNWLAGIVIVGTDSGRGATKSKWREIELIENVVGAQAQLDLGSFSDEFHRGEPKLLSHAEINVLKPRATESVSPYSWELREAARSLQCEVRVRILANARESREVSGSWRQKRRVFGIVSSGTVVGDRPNRVKTD